VDPVAAALLVEDVHERVVAFRATVDDVLWGGGVRCARTGV
jgi:hypothetical protein